MVEMSAAKKPVQNYKNRLITHPNFQNISMEQAEAMLKEGSDGDFIIRPASRGKSTLSTARCRRFNGVRCDVLERELEDI